MVFRVVFEGFSTFSEGLRRFLHGFPPFPQQFRKPLGSQKLYDFVNDNLSVNLKDVAYTNNVEVIASQESMIGFSPPNIWGLELGRS